MIPSRLQNIFGRLKAAWHERAVALKAISFAFVGVINTCVDFSVFWAANQVLGVPLIPANVMSWVCGVTCSYTLNSFITFGPESGHTLRWRDYAKFAAGGVAGMVASTAAVFGLSYVVPVLAAKLLSILVAFSINFSMSHFVIYRKRGP
jgi:putative flippase GtrA